MTAQSPEHGHRRWPWAVVVLLAGAALVVLNPAGLLLGAPALLVGAAVTYRRSRDAEVRAVAAGALAGSGVLLALAAVLTVVFALGAVVTSGGSSSVDPPVTVDGPPP